MGNMKKTLSILLFLLIGYFVHGQENDMLVIELITDSNPEETSYKLFDVENNLIYERNNFDGQETHFDTVLIDVEKCHYWELYDSFNDGFEGQGSSQDGDFKIYLNDILVAECEDPNFGSKLIIYNLGSGCVNNDIEVVELVQDSDMFFGEYFISAKVKNVGNEVFNSLTCWYSINTDTVEVKELELSLAQGEELIINYPVPVFFSEEQNFTLSFGVNNVNGTLDKNTDNNTVSKQIQINNGFEFIPMIEVFTSSTCAPCAGAATYLKNLFNNNIGNYSVLKHQMSFPHPGDPYNKPIYTEPRYDYYGGNFGIPRVVVNGESYENYKSLDQNYFNSVKNQTADMGIAISGYSFNDSVSTTVTLFSVNDIPEDNNYVVQAYIFENKTTKNTGNNGQTEFYNVMMRALPSSEGTDLGSMKSFEKKEFIFNESMRNTFVEEMDDLYVVVFIQNNSTKEIVQSKMAKLIEGPQVTISINSETDFEVSDNITIQSHQALRNIDNSEIVIFDNIIGFFETDDPAQEVEYVATISADKKKIVLDPVNDLDFNTQYTVRIRNLENENDISMGTVESTFKTITTSLSNDVQSGLIIYPNPVKSNLFIENKYHKYMEIFDQSCRSVMSVELKYGKNVIDVSSFAQGFYFGVCVGNVNHETIKIVIE